MLYGLEDDGFLDLGTTKPTGNPPPIWWSPRPTTVEEYIQGISRISKPWSDYFMANPGEAEQYFESSTTVWTAEAEAAQAPLKTAPPATNGRVVIPTSGGGNGGTIRPTYRERIHPRLLRTTQEQPEYQQGYEQPQGYKEGVYTEQAQSPFSAITDLFKGNPMMLYGVIGLGVYLLFFKDKGRSRSRKHDDDED